MRRLVLAVFTAAMLVPAGQAMAQGDGASAAPVAVTDTPDSTAAPAQSTTTTPTGTDTTPTGTDTTPTGTDTTPTENTDDPDDEEFGEDVNDNPEPKQAPAPAQAAAPAPAPAPVLPRTGSDSSVLLVAIYLLLLGFAIRYVSQPARRS
jgi:hypothetical protein